MKKLPKDVISHEGLLFRLLGVQEADSLAQSYGLPYAERLVKALEDQQGKMSFHVQELRPEVLAFALLMEQRLREKDADRGGNSWQNATLVELFTPMMSKAIAVEKAIFRTKESPAKHAVDLANYAMMIADVAGALDEAVEIINGEPQH